MEEGNYFEEESEMEKTEAEIWEKGRGRGPGEEGQNIEKEKKWGRKSQEGGRKRGGRVKGWYIEAERNVGKKEEDAKRRLRGVGGRRLSIQRGREKCEKEEGYWEKGREG